MLRRILIIALCFFSLELHAQIKVTTGGRVGIRASNPDPGYDVHIKGAVLCIDQSWPSHISDNLGGFSTIHPGVDGYGYIGTDTKRYQLVAAMHVHCIQTGYYSDRRIKTNIKSLGSSIDKLKLLNAVTYDINPVFLGATVDSIKRDMTLYKDRIGFIAQDFEKVFPNLVEYDKKSDLYAINYVSLIPVLVEAMKEQQATIEALNEKISRLTSDQNLSSNSELFNTARLEQNQPNPFTQTTSIKYGVPENAINAKINIYNLNGTQLETHTLPQKGNGTLLITGGKLSPGIYIYNLIIDGREIDSKRMVLTN